jgi:hypothetical protein
MWVVTSSWGTGWSPVTENQTWILCDFLTPPPAPCCICQVTNFSSQIFIATEGQNCSLRESFSSAEFMWYKVTAANDFWGNLWTKRSEISTYWFELRWSMFTVLTHGCLLQGFLNLSLHSSSSSATLEQAWYQLFVFHTQKSFHVMKCDSTNWKNFLTPFNKSIQYQKLEASYD